MILDARSLASLERHDHQPALNSVGDHERVCRVLRLLNPAGVVGCDLRNHRELGARRVLDEASLSLRHGAHSSSTWTSSSYASRFIEARPDATRDSKARHTLM